MRSQLRAGATAVTVGTASVIRSKWNSGAVLAAVVNADDDACCSLAYIADAEATDAALLLTASRSAYSSGPKDCVSMAANASCAVMVGGPHHPQGA